MEKKILFKIPKNKIKYSGLPYKQRAKWANYKTVLKGIKVDILYLIFFIEQLNSINMSVLS